MATGIDVGQLQRKVDELQSKIETYELQRKVDVDRLQSEVDRLRIDVGADPRLSEVDVDQLEREAERATSNDAPLKERNNYEKIKALLWIKDQRTPPVYREALEEWDKKSIVVASSIERKTKQVESLKNEIYNLVGFYSVFQGVVFTAVAQGNEHFFTCSKCFIAIVLSILASVVSFVGVWQKHQKIQYLEDKLEEDHVYKKELDSRESRLRSDCENFRFANLSNCRSPGKRKKTTVSVFISSAALFAFAAFFPFSHYWILCKH